MPDQKSEFLVYAGGVKALRDLFGDNASQGQLRLIHDGLSIKSSIGMVRIVAVSDYSEELFVQLIPDGIPEGLFPVLYETLHAWTPKWDAGDAVKLQLASSIGNFVIKNEAGGKVGVFMYDDSDYLRIWVKP